MGAGVDPGVRAWDEVVATVAVLYVAAAVQAVVAAVGVAAVAGAVEGGAGEAEAVVDAAAAIVTAGDGRPFGCKAMVRRREAVADAGLEDERGADDGGAADVGLRGECADQGTAWVVAAPVVAADVYGVACVAAAGTIWVFAGGACAGVVAASA